ncbi:hypothetical protein C8R46DRAFT_1342521 [Mycena filopes]|nr:hypothetical protein C8R46DRAFT_1342521 [Mycena filopes]
MTTTRCTNCGFIPVPHTPGNAPPDLHDLRRRLSTLDALITALSAERQKLQVVSDAVVYPILSLPTEITTEIFLHSCDSSPWSPSTGPLLLAQICHEWREIAIHTPALWQSVHFAARSSVELLQLWLGRSGDAPLDLVMHGWGTQIGPLIAASTSHSHHWQDVKFILPFHLYASIDLGNLPLPILRSIALDVFTSHSNDPPVTGVVARVNAPMLYEAHLRMPTGVKVDLHWSQLTTLTLNAVDLTQCISTLRKCPDLVKLSVSTSGPAPSHTEPVFLHALESLECNMTQGSILEHLTLPRLHALAFTHTVEPQNALILENCIRRSTCPRVFSIPCHGLELETLTTYLAAVSDSVSDLELALPPVDLLPALTPMDILPHLKILRVRGTQASRADYQHFADMLQLRLRPSPPRVALAEFTLDFHMGRSLMNQHSLPTASTMAQFRALVADGLKVKLTLSGKQGRLQHTLRFYSSTLGRMQARHGRARGASLPWHARSPPDMDPRRLSVLASIIRWPGHRTAPSSGGHSLPLTDIEPEHRVAYGRRKRNDEDVGTTESTGTRASTPAGRADSSTPQEEQTVSAADACNVIHGDEDAQRRCPSPPHGGRTCPAHAFASTVEQPHYLPQVQGVTQRASRGDSLQARDGHRPRRQQ